MLPSAIFSLPSSTALPPLNAAAGSTEPAAGAQATPDFADLLKQVSGQASPPVADGQPGDAAETESAAVGARAQAASMAKAAAATGKILPVALPVAAKPEDGPEPADQDASAEPARTDEPAAVADLASALPSLLAPTLPETAKAGERLKVPAKDSPEEALAAVVAPLSARPEPAIVTGPPVARAAALSSSGRNVALVPFAPGVAAETARKPRAGEGQSTNALAAAAVQVSVAARPAAGALQALAAVHTAAEAASAEPVATARPKTARSAGKPGVDAPAQAERVAAALPSAVQPDAAPSVGAAQAASAPAPHAPADINAALDRLLAAREALSPVEAVLAVDHADFGEVSIRFEHSSDGQLSAELSGADPDLQRAATAAMAADGSLSTSSEGAGGRSTNLANSRSFAAGGEAAPGERGQPGNDRELDRRRAPGRLPTGAGASDTPSGIFA